MGSFVTKYPRISDTINKLHQYHFSYQMGKLNSNKFHHFKHCSYHIIHTCNKFYQINSNFYHPISSNHNQLNSSAYVQKYLHSLYRYEHGFDIFFAYDYDNNIILQSSTSISSSQLTTDFSRQT